MTDGANGLMLLAGQQTTTITTMTMEMTGADIERDLWEDSSLLMKCMMRPFDVVGRVSGWSELLLSEWNYNPNLLFFVQKPPKVRFQFTEKT